MYTATVALTLVLLNGEALGGILVNLSIYQQGLDLCARVAGCLYQTKLVLFIFTKQS